LAGKTNVQVAAFFQRLFADPCQGLDVQILATALNVYASTRSLGGTMAAAYGFTVSAAGLGADSFDLGRRGPLFSAPPDTILNVYEILEAANAGAVDGVPYDRNRRVEVLVCEVFNDINEGRCR